MGIESEKRSDRRKVGSRRNFLSKSSAIFAGAMAFPIVNISEPDEAKLGANCWTENDDMQIFDCHLHSPADSGEAWQWYKVTETFDDFVKYLDNTGVGQGIINSQRSYGQKPEEFIAGNREVARNVDRYKGRFLGACVVNPQYIDEALKEIEYCHDQLGFVWVGELCNYMVPYNYSSRSLRFLSIMW